MIDKIESNSSIYKETERNSKMIDPSVLEKETNVEETHMGDFAWKGLDDN